MYSRSELRSIAAVNHVEILEPAYDPQFNVEGDFIYEAKQFGV
jgi:hypothetical protein